MTCHRALARFTQTEPEAYEREELNKLLKVCDAEERL
jgi:hypothetical protein